VIDHLSRADQPCTVTITIKYTNDGFSIDRRSDDSCGWCFFVDARLDTGREARIRSMFAAEHARTTKDYLCNGGRTRVLELAMPRSESLALELSGRLLREVYGLTSDDELVIHSHP
jgi:hypothetical protein